MIKLSDATDVQHRLRGRQAAAVARPRRVRGHNDVSLYFEFRDLDGLHAHLRGKGVRRMPPAKTSYGLMQMSFRDPDGFELCYRATRVAALYDIHGNLPALDAVLAEARREQVDLIVVGGDVVPGRCRARCITRLLAARYPRRFISGNGERVVLAAMNGAPIDEVPAQYRDIIYWNAGGSTPNASAR